MYFSFLFFFPVTLQEALVSKQVDGPLLSLLQFFLHAAFQAQEFLESEEGSEVASTPAVFPAVPGRASDGLSDGQATQVAKSTVHCHGSKLRDVDVTASTVTEVVRLHLLAVGGHFPGEEKH